MGTQSRSTWLGSAHTISKRDQGPSIEARHCQSCGVQSKKNAVDIAEKLVNKPKQLSIMLPMMKLLEYEIAESSWSLTRKRMVNLVASLCFNRSFGIHEILAKERHNYDPTVCLLARDLKVVSIAGEEGNEEVMTGVTPNTIILFYTI